MLDTAAAHCDAPTPLDAVNRSGPPLRGSAVLRQRWDEIAYFHWAYSPQVVQRLLPAGVTVDTFGGAAWVGLIPFEMRKVRVGPGPVVPYLGHFIEINVRTYVIDPHGRRGVWFFSLDVPRSWIVGVARSVFSLPYCWARADHEVLGDRHVYRMQRRWPHRRRPAAQIAFTVGDELIDDERTALDDFLTARWALLTTRRGRLQYGPVHHPPWRLHRATAVEVSGGALEAAGLPAPEGLPHSVYSPGTAVEVGWFEGVTARTPTKRTPTKEEQP